MSWEPDRRNELAGGCLAGPVFAAAVILPKDFFHPLLNDSKQLSATERNEVRPFIEANAIAWAVGIADHSEIDTINILNASFLAMHRALDQIRLKPSRLLIDGNRFKQYKSIKHQCIIEGDAKYASIAAASILAKTYRDEFMVSIDQMHPVYLWKKNKGYATREHRTAILTHGICNFHRKSFTLYPEQLELELHA
jgi:ribonuclease HII